MRPLYKRYEQPRSYGIFNVTIIRPVFEEQVLEEWVSYIVTLGLLAIICLVDVDPIRVTAETFAKTQSAGLTNWKTTTSRLVGY